MSATIAPKSERCETCSGRLEFETRNGHLVERCPACEERERRALARFRARNTASATGTQCTVKLCGGVIVNGKCPACEKRNKAFPPPPPRPPKPPKPAKPASRPCEVCEVTVARKPDRPNGRIGYLPKLCPACEIAKRRTKQRRWANARKERGS